jgi:hypothetical protein
MFFDALKKFVRRVARSRRAMRHVRRALSSTRNMWCRCARERAPLCKNTGFFAAL